MRTIDCAIIPFLRGLSGNSNLNFTQAMFSAFRLLSIYYRNNMHCYCSSKCMANNHHIVHNGYIIHANLFSMRPAIRWQIKYETCRSTSGTNGIRRKRAKTFNIICIWNLVQFSTPNYVNARFFKMHFFGLWFWHGGPKWSKRMRFLLHLLSLALCVHAFNATKIAIRVHLFLFRKTLPNGNVCLHWH